MEDNREVREWKVRSKYLLNPMLQNMALRLPNLSKHDSGKQQLHASRRC